MNRIMLAALAITVAAPAQAAERRYTVTDFDRVRVDGPFVVTLATGWRRHPTAIWRRSPAHRHLTAAGQRRAMLAHDKGPGR